MLNGFRKVWLTRTCIGITGLLASATGFVACERLEPAPENDVKFQATGTYSIGTGVLREHIETTLRVRQGPTGYVLELHDKESDALLVSSFMVLGSLEIGDQRGPMQTALLDTDHDGVNDKLTVTQSFSVDKPVMAIGGPKSAGAISAVFRREESRWMWFSAGYVEHGTKGQVSVILAKGDGSEAGRFVGVTTTQPQQRVIGLDVPGNLSQGGQWGGSSSGFAVVNLPNGAGSLVVTDPMGDRWQQRFSFDPRKDLTGQDITMNLIHADENYVELTTDLTNATLALRHVEVDRETSASGTAHFGYSLVVAITRNYILVQGTNRFDAKLAASNGETSSFEGSDSHVDTMLDW